MCGIAGIVSLGERPVPDVLEGMVGTLYHRGPDDMGICADPHVAIGMRRLSIIGVKNGRQPIFNEDDSVALVLNGEIYNHEALRRTLQSRGHSFSTDSDAEVAVHLYEMYGVDFVDHLHGMFALAIYDKRSRRVILARDRAGKKPLYYAECDGYLLFGSESKAIHASGLLPREVDPGSLRSFLSYGYVVGEGSMFRQVRKLPAGHRLEVSGGSARAVRYWDPPAGGAAPASIDEAAGKLREMLVESVRRRLMSEVPLGAFLSGGIDSSAIVGIMAGLLGQPFHTFCVGFEDGRLDELHHARAIAAHYGTRHHELLLKGCSLELLRDVNYFNDEPVGDPAALPTFCLARFARRHIKVALTGEGGDESFAGYRHYGHCLRLSRLTQRLPGLSLVARAISRRQARLRPLAPNLPWKGIWIAGLPRGERTRGWLSVFTDVEVERLLRPELRQRDADAAVIDAFRALQSRAGDCDPVSQLLYVDSRSSLADELLMKVDKMTMASSLEARCPLLDQELLEFAFRLPPAMKISGKGSKLVLRRALKDLVPAETLNRGKQGFDPPLDRWLQHDMRPFVESGLLGRESPIGRYLDVEIVRRMWRQSLTEPQSLAARQLWRIVNLGVWLELHWPTGLLSGLPDPSSRVGDRHEALLAGREVVVN